MLRKNLEQQKEKKMKETREEDTTPF